MFANKTFEEVGVIFFAFSFSLIRQKSDTVQKETKKSRKNEASTRMPSPGPAIFPGRRTSIANFIGSSGICHPVSGIRHLSTTTKNLANPQNHQL